MKTIFTFTILSLFIVSLSGQSGRVGIGIDLPTRLLHIEGDLNSTDNLLYSRVTNTNAIDIRAIEAYSVTNPGYGIGGHFTGGYRALYALNSGGNYAGIPTYGIFTQSTGTAGTRIGLHAEASGGDINLAARFGDGDVEVQNGMRLGSTSQLGRFHLNNANTLWGGSAIALRIYSTNTVSGATYGARITTSSSANADVFGVRATADKTGGTGFAYGMHTEVPETDGWAFYAVGKNYMSNDLRIGTTSDPYSGAYRLIVDGKVISEELRIQNSSLWPDYVFADDYKLMPLSELEQTIKENGHLPNIPPASKINVEGFDVGDIQIRMMEKIEELTLHIIALEKRIASLEIEKK